MGSRSAWCVIIEGTLASTWQRNNAESGIPVYSPQEYTCDLLGGKWEGEKQYMAKVQEIVPGVYRVDAVKIPYVVSVLLIRDGDGWVLVDTGRSSTRIQEALTAVGARPDELKCIYLTHHHSEHIS